MIALEKLTTEQRNPATEHIDELPTLDMVALMNAEDKKVAEAVEKILPQIARAIDLIAEKLQKGGHLFYMGAGTSGRLGILDAVECPPTYGTDYELVQGLIAGGATAIFQAKEGAEDDPALGRADLEEAGFAAKDGAEDDSALGHRLHPHESWHRPEDGAQHAFHRHHGKTGQGLRQSHGGCESHQ